jgi:hypothetical protein
MEETPTSTPRQASWYVIVARPQAGDSRDVLTPLSELLWVQFGYVHPCEPNNPLQIF